MRSRHLTRSVSLALLVAAAIPATAAAEVGHVVKPGETLWTIAAANNLTTRTVAAYNGLPENANVVLGSTIRVPTTAEGAAVLQRQGIPTTLVAPTAATGTTGGATTTTAASTAAPKPMGGYTVRPGDTLSGLAAGSGVSLAQLAAMNGLSTSHRVIAGTVLKLPSGAPAPTRAAQPAPVTTVVPKAAPQAAPAGSAPPTCSRSPRRPASPPRWPPPSAGRRAASTTARSPRPTPAASCR